MYEKEGNIKNDLFIGFKLKLFKNQSNQMVTIRLVCLLLFFAAISQCNRHIQPPIAGLSPTYKIKPMNKEPIVLEKLTANKHIYDLQEFFTRQHEPHVDYSLFGIDHRKTTKEQEPPCKIRQPTIGLEWINGFPCAGRYVDLTVVNNTLLALRTTGLDVYKVSNKSLRHQRTHIQINHDNAIRIDAFISVRNLTVVLLFDEDGTIRYTPLNRLMDGMDFPMSELSIKTLSKVPPYVRIDRELPIIENWIFVPMGSKGIEVYWFNDDTMSFELFSISDEMKELMLLNEPDYNITQIVTDSHNERNDVFIYERTGNSISCLTVSVQKTGKGTEVPHYMILNQVEVLSGGLGFIKMFTSPETSLFRKKLYVLRVAILGSYPYGLEHYERVDEKYISRGTEEIQSEVQEISHGSKFGALIKTNLLQLFLRGYPFQGEVATEYRFDGVIYASFNRGDYWHPQMIAVLTNTHVHLYEMSIRDALLECQNTHTGVFEFVVAGFSELCNSKLKKHDQDPRKICYEEKKFELTINKDSRKEVIWKKNATTGGIIAGVVILFVIILGVVYCKLRKTKRELLRYQKLGGETNPNPVTEPGKIESSFNLGQQHKKDLKNIPSLPVQLESDRKPGSK